MRNRLLNIVAKIYTERITNILGHARLTEPPGRSTAWRFGFSTPTNYNDNELNCGGFNVSMM